MNYLNKQAINDFIDAALQEDVGDGDHSSLASIPANEENKAQLLVKDNGIVAGVELAEIIFARVNKNLKVNIHIKDGSAIKYGDIVLDVEGNARSILLAERLVLNCMQRMSGIATKTFKLNQLIQHTGCKLLDTRKTTPNFRLPEKWAVAIGGGINHRFGLFDMIILKDNHVDFAGGIEKAIKATKDYLVRTGKKLKIEVETRNLEEIKQVLKVGGIDRIMLDNMDIPTLKEAVALINKQYETEASGGITEETIAAIASTGVDYISVGALTHSVKSLDLSLKAIKK
ncbi:MAG: carboxylating nicotinate-nucleotide diphosphorylase [Cytophagaceae bacterium]